MPPQVSWAARTPSRASRASRAATGWPSRGAASRPSAACSGCRRTTASTPRTTPPPCTATSPKAPSRTTWGSARTSARTSRSSRRRRWRVTQVRATESVRQGRAVCLFVCFFPHLPKTTFTFQEAKKRPVEIKQTGFIMFLHKVCRFLFMLVTAALCHLLALCLGALLIERNTNQSEAKDSLASAHNESQRIRGSFFLLFLFTGFCSAASSHLLPHYLSPASQPFFLVFFFFSRSS